MSHTPAYPKRLIEVDLPIKKISEHASREKSLTHGHILTLHIWWARRPLAACRAVICGALWPDPADEHCPEAFREAARARMAEFWNPTGTTPRTIEDPLELRKALLDFIADFANWDHSTDERYLNTARALTQVAHEALGGEPGTRPLVVDPFAGGGSIPLEALRVGADAYASDINPVAVLINKVILEYTPKYGVKLANEVRKWGKWIRSEAQNELIDYYPEGDDESNPIAYLWARTIVCEGPDCGAVIPLIRSLWLAKKGNKSVSIKIVPNKHERKIEIEIIKNPQPSEVFEGTVKRGSATCPCCGYTTPVLRVREQLKSKSGGVRDSLLFCVVASTKSGETIYRKPTESDFKAIKEATKELERRKLHWKGNLSLIPDEQTPQGGGKGAGRAFSQRHYGMDKFENLFTPRQNLMLSTYARLVNEVPISDQQNGFDSAVKTLLGLTISKVTDYSSSLCVWRNLRTCISHTFSRQTIPIVWDYGEMNPFVGSAGDFSEALEYLSKTIEHISNSISITGSSVQADATVSTLPTDSVNAFITDPPYYDSVPYADLSDYFYVWLRRVIGDQQKSIFSTPLSPKNEECIVDEVKGKDKCYFEATMTKAMSEGRRILIPSGIGIVVFAHKSTSGWEAQLKALIDSGWVITGSWPIDTERPSRLRARDSAALASSIHLVCRPRENPDGSIREEIGDWHDVLAELPVRIHEWMPRLKEENVVGADAIFACLGPALEIFSRYSRVERASGEQVTLREYLEHVWAAVSREALSMIFEGADATGFEEDARITAIWLWTLKTQVSPALNGTNGKNGIVEAEVEEAEEEEDAGASGKKKPVTGFALEYDAARKIAQGLGVHLEAMPTLVEIKKGNARLLPVAERAGHLLKKEEGHHQRRPQRKKEKQATLFPVALDEEIQEAAQAAPEIAEPGETVLDRVHQSMLLFGVGQSEALKKFLVDDGVGRDAQFWKLAQALTALYPAGTEEKRWVEGILARKKGLGL